VPANGAAVLPAIIMSMPCICAAAREAAPQASGQNPAAGKTQCTWRR
jgi:hypothetical protein